MTTNTHTSCGTVAMSASILRKYPGGLFFSAADIVAQLGCILSSLPAVRIGYRETAGTTLS